MEIHVDNLTKTIRGVTVLEDVNLRLKSGRIYGLQGKNGSGKTMLMRALCGLILPTKGSISIDGAVLGKDISFPESVGVLIENPSFLGGYTGFRNLKMLAAIKNTADDKAIREAMTRVGLDPEDRRKYRKYSLGMKQRLGIACAVMESPGLLILDEPLNALDDTSVSMVRDLIREKRDQGALVVLACHDGFELESLSDEIYRIGEGRICGAVSRKEEGDE